jgi:hypothetical protein
MEEVEWQADSCCMKFEPGWVDGRGRVKIEGGVDSYVSAVVFFFFLCTKSSAVLLLRALLARVLVVVFLSGSNSHTSIHVEAMSRQIVGTFIDR